MLEDAYLYAAGGGAEGMTQRYRVRRGTNGELDIDFRPSREYSPSTNLWIGIVVDVRGPWDGHVAVDTRTMETGRHVHHQTFKADLPDAGPLEPVMLPIGVIRHRGKKERRADVIPDEA